jgi:prepilin-type N-terminal cleavage/methylation domain-containing protein
MKTQKGFTLIELLVVIAIIGLLSSIVTSTTSASRVKARESKRYQEARSVQLALELYAADHDGMFPAVGDSTNLLVCNHVEQSAAIDVLEEELVPTYISQIPVDPSVNDALCYRYMSSDDAGDGLAKQAVFSFTSEVTKQWDADPALIGIAVGEPDLVTYEDSGYPDAADKILNTSFDRTGSSVN